MQHFNPRSPRGGATYNAALKATREIFQSTLPTRGSDEAIGTIKEYLQYFNPRSPRGGATAFDICRKEAAKEFQSTLPTRGSDARAFPTPARAAYFNPRSPRGGATAEKCICIQHFREFTEYYPLRHGDARCIAPQDCIIQAFFGAKERRFYVRLCFALKNIGIRG